MASLTRVFAKLFGGTADPNVTGEIGQFGSAKLGTKLNTADIATIQALSAYDKGWSAAVVTNRNYPPIEEVTGVLKTLSYQICYMLQEGVAEYDSATEYKAGSFCKVNNIIYYSKTNNNINNSVSNGTYWGVFGDSRWVLKAGDTMTGNLTIVRTGPNINLRNTDETVGTTPSTQLNKTLTFADGFGTTVGYIMNQYETDGSRRTLINSRNGEGTANTYISVGYNANGVAETFTPTPAVNTTSYNNIVNVAFLRNYIKCGEISINPNSEATINFPTAFPGTDYYVVLGRRSEPTTSQIVDLPWVRVKYAGSMRIYNPSNGTVTMAWAAIWRN